MDLATGSCSEDVLIRDRSRLSGAELPAKPAGTCESVQPTARCSLEEAQSAQRQVEVSQLDERIASLQVTEQAQYVAISTLETSLDSRHTRLATLEARVAELEDTGQSDLDTLREMSNRQNDIAETLKQLITDNQGQAQARAKIIDSQRQQLAARHRRNLLKQAEGDEVAAKLLATRRETMRLRSKIRELKEQHAQLRHLKESQQLQLASAAAGVLQSCAETSACKDADSATIEGNYSSDRSDQSV